MQTSSIEVVPYETFEDAFYWSAAWYNGQEDNFDKVLNYLKEIRNDKTREHKSINRPDFIKPIDPDPIMELYWMLLVMQYGDYGTSPRSGWIDAKNLDTCIAHIERMKSRTYGQSEY